MRVLISLGHGTRNGIRLAIEVQAGHLRQPHAGIEAAGVRLAREHLHVVAQLDESAAQVADVDALPAAVRLAPVGQQGNTHIQFTPDFGADERWLVLTRFTRGYRLDLRSESTTGHWTCVQTIV